MPRKRSLKQEWVFERLYQHKGSLSSMITNLLRLQRASSTLPYEREFLLNAERSLRLLNMERDKENSWLRFKRQEEKGEK